MLAQNVVVIGANRGIGQKILKALSDPRDPSVDELMETGASVLEVDYLDETTIKKAALDYGDRPLDILVNVGGLPPDPKPWIEQTDTDIIEKFRVMAIGPFLAIKHFLPKLELAENPRVINISSAFGSISENSFGTCMAYRTAKTALNQMSVTLAREWERENRKATIVCMEPGFIATRLTNFDGVDDMDECVTGIVKVIDGITHKDNGAFLKWDGSKIPF